MKAKSALSLALAAGIASTAAASNTPTTLGASTGRVVKAAHIYYNLATGERVVTMLGGEQTAAADTGNSESIWACLNANPCEAQGYTTSYFFGVDNPGTTSLSTAVTNVDWGDIASDTVVDCVHIDWVVAHADTDSDSTPNVGDGVVGLAGQWTIFDADNGRFINQSTRTPIISFILTDLPGNIFGAGSLTGYTADIDLTSTFSSDLTFEIGDSDGDPQGASFHNPLIGTFDNDFDGFPDSDLDGDSLFDWSWGVRFYQPGTEDFDSDGNVDGVPAPTDADTIGVSFAVPDGTAVDNGDGTWTWDIDTSTPDAGTGEEDAFAIYDTNDEHAGTFFFGGFACEGDPLPDGDGYTPFSAFEFQLWGPGGENPCPADLNDDGVYNFFDVSLFLQDFAQGGDYNGDGASNFFDVSKFLADFAAGCP